MLYIRKIGRGTGYRYAEMVKRIGNKARAVEPLFGVGRGIFVGDTEGSTRETDQLCRGGSARIDIVHLVGAICWRQYNRFAACRVCNRIRRRNGVGGLVGASAGEYGKKQKTE